MNEIQMISDIFDAAQRMNKPQTIKLFKEKLLDLIKRRRDSYHDITLAGLPEVNLQRLVEDVCRVFNVTHDQFTVTARHVQIIYPRHVYHKVAYDHRISTLRHIGKYSGVKDHTTVLNSYKRSNSLVFVKDPGFMLYWEKYISDGDPYFTKIYERKTTSIAC